jgi:hypothetical protein
MSKAFRWDDGAARVESLRGKISAGVERFRSESYRSATLPGAVSMADYIAGKPKPVIARRRTDDTVKGRGKVQRLVLNASASGAIGASVLERRGAAVMALADAIEKRGGRVEIVVALGIRQGVDQLHAYVTVKRASQRLNLNSVAFAM